MKRFVLVLVAACHGSDPPPAGVDSGTGSPDASVSIDAPVPPGVCGNGTCEPDETATTCCEDCGVCGDQAAVTIETGVPAGGPGTGVTPGGMAASYSTFAGGPFTAMQFPIEVTDAPIDGATYFWAQTFYFGTSDQTGYTGLQTGSRCGGGTPGKRAIFSIWDATSATPGPGASCRPFGGEGIGYQCCTTLAWRAGVAYRFEVTEVAAGQWRMTIHDPTTRSDLVLGTITAPPSYGRLTAQTTGFTEYYTEVDGCSTVPHARATLYQPSADGAPATEVHPITYGTCQPQATATCAGPACR